MYAIIDIAGQQFKVEKNNKVFVHRLENEEGSQISLDKVLLIDNNGKVSVGEPLVEGASIVAKVISHVKGDKVLVFKKKRRKSYQVLNGHRQYFTELEIEEILEKGQKAKVSTQKAVEKKADIEVKKETKEDSSIAEAKVEKETPAEPKTTAKKVASKTTAKAATEKKETKSPVKKAATAKKAAPKTTVKKASSKTTVKKETPKAETKKENKPKDKAE